MYSTSKKWKKRSPIHTNQAVFSHATTRPTHVFEPLH